jgi:2-polyprenyl-3-methyl-5-hydroxy-6-metoxy-1,4-benzoquinol methylase
MKSNTVVNLFAVVLVGFLFSGCSHGHKDHHHDHHKAHHACQHDGDSKTCSDKSHEHDAHGHEGHACGHKDANECKHKDGECDCKKGDGQKGAAHRKHHHHDFSDAEKYAKRFNDPARSKWQNPKGIIEVMAVKPGEKVAEIGAGTGYMLPFLSEAVGAQGAVYALDVEQPLIDYMKKYAKQKGLKNTKVEKIPYDNPSIKDFGLSKVLFLVTWHHVENKDNYVRELSKQLAKGSAVTIVEPDYSKTDRPSMTPPKHFHLTPGEVVTAFEKGDFNCKVANENLKYDVAVVCTRQ